MRVGFFGGPNLFDYRGSDANPYSALLVEALQRRGLTIERLQYRGAPAEAPCADAGRLWRSRRRVRVLHFQWIFGYYLAASAPRAWLRLIRFTGRLALARLLGYRVVWTLHNLIPHERPHRGIDVANRPCLAVLAHAICARNSIVGRFRRRTVGGSVLRPARAAPPTRLVGRVDRPIDPTRFRPPHRE